MGRSRVNPSREYFRYDKTTKKNFCLVCNKPMTGDHAANLERHLRRSHKDEFAMVQMKKLSQEAKAAASKSPQPQHMTDHGGRSKFLKVNLNKETILNACVELLTVNGCSFEILECSGFKKILNPVFTAIGNNFSVNSKSMKLLIPEIASKIVGKISDLLQDKMISLKVDIANRLNKFLLGIHAQIIIDGKINLFTLGIIELKEKCTGIYINHIIGSILEKYNINTRQIYSVTTDNGVNTIKFNVETEEECTENSVELNISFTNLNGIRCAADILQLAIKDSLKHSEINEFIAECRELVTKLRMVEIEPHFKVYNVKKPALDCAGKWTTTFIMLQGLLKCKTICSVLSEHNREIDFATVKWTKLEVMIETLQPLSEATLKLQTEQLTLSDFFGIWMESKLRLDNSNNFLADIISENMANREEILLQNDCLLGSVFLDPRFQILLTQSQKARAMQHLLHVWQKLMFLGRKYEREIKEEKASQEETDEFENFLKSREMTMHGASYADSDTAINYVLASFENVKRLDRKKSVLQFWEENKNDFPQLYRIAEVVLGAPATQISVERSFSALKFILSENSGGLTETLLQDVLIVRANFNVYQNL